MVPTPIWRSSTGSTSALSAMRTLLRPAGLDARRLRRRAVAGWSHQRARDRSRRRARGRRSGVQLPRRGRRTARQRRHHRGRRHLRHEGLSAGHHRLEFYGPYAFDNGYISEWWDDRASFYQAEHDHRDRRRDLDRQRTLSSPPRHSDRQHGSPYHQRHAQGRRVSHRRSGIWSVRERRVRLPVAGRRFSDRWSPTARPTSIRRRRSARRSAFAVTASRPGLLVPHGRLARALHPSSRARSRSSSAPTLDNATRVGDQGRVVPGSMGNGCIRAGRGAATS